MLRYGGYLYRLAKVRLNFDRDPHGRMENQECWQLTSFVNHSELLVLLISTLFKLYIKVVNNILITLALIIKWSLLTGIVL